MTARTRLLVGGVGVAVLVGSVPVLFAVQTPPVRKQDKPIESIKITVEDQNGRCVIANVAHDPIYTEGGRTITWTVAGSCSGAPPIEIDPNFRDGTATRVIIVPAKRNSLKTTASEGNQMTGRVKGKQQLPNADTRVLYKYRILIGQPALVQQTYDWEFNVCPIWPC